MMRWPASPHIPELTADGTAATAIVAAEQHATNARTRTGRILKRFRKVASARRGPCLFDSRIAAIRSRVDATEKSNEWGEKPGRTRSSSQARSPLQTVEPRRRRLDEPREH